MVTDDLVIIVYAVFCTLVNSVFILAVRAGVFSSNTDRSGRSPILRPRKWQMVNGIILCAGCIVFFDQVFGSSTEPLHLAMTWISAANLSIAMYMLAVYSDRKWRTTHMLISGAFAVFFISRYVTHFAVIRVIELDGWLTQVPTVLTGMSLLICVYALVHTVKVRGSWNS